MQVEGDPGRRRGVSDGYLALPHFAVAFPCIHRTLAADTAAVGLLHRRILVVGRPSIPLAEGVDEREYLFRRGLDPDRALDMENARPGRDIDQDGKDGCDNYDSDGFQHDGPPWIEPA